MKTRFDVRKKYTHRLFSNRLLYILFGSGLTYFVTGIFLRDTFIMLLGIICSLPVIRAILDDLDHCDHYLEQVNSKTYRILK